MTLITAHENITIKQTVVKTELRHNEFGMSAALPIRSRRCSQSTKAGISTVDVTNIAIFPGDLMLDASFVNVLGRHKVH